MSNVDGADGTDRLGRGSVRSHVARAGEDGGLVVVVFVMVVVRTRACAMLLKQRLKRMSDCEKPKLIQFN
jgi:hypothetical protein